MNEIRLVVEDEPNKEVILSNFGLREFRMVLSDKDGRKIDHIFTKEELKTIVKAIRFMNVDIVKDALFDA